MKSAADNSQQPTQQPRQGQRRKEVNYTMNTKSTRHNSSEHRWFLHLLYWLAASVGVLFAVFNIIPYERAVRFLFGTAIADSGLLELISGVPIVNAVTGVSAIAAFWIMGFILWGFLQTMELFEKFLKRNRAFVQQTIQDAEGHQRYAIQEQDDPLLKGLKKVYNRMPLLTIKNARQAKLIAYSLDFCICLAVYPPVDGGFSRLMIVLFTGQWGLLDWGNVAALFATLFVVEWIVDLLFWISDILRVAKTVTTSPEY